MYEPVTHFLLPFNLIQFRKLTLDTTARKVIPCITPYQAPMFSTLSARGRRDCVTILKASRRISPILLSRANRGASGKAATNNVTNPYWITENQRNGIFIPSESGKVLQTQCATKTDRKSCSKADKAAKL